MNELLTIFKDTTVEIEWNRVLDSLKGAGIKVTLEVRDNPITFVPPDQRIDIAKEFASAKIVDGKRPVIDPFIGEVTFEMHRFSGRKILGILYDAQIVRNIYYKILSKWMQSNPLDEPYIIITDDLIGTLDDDGFYHGRTALFSCPTLVSISGFKYALARDKEYYLSKALKHRFRIPEAEPDEPVQISAQVLLSRYIIQAIFFFRTGYPFCEEKNCMLFNAHSVREIVQSQVESDFLCRRHRNMLTYL
ncbi:MAG: hypothetical protein QXO76_10240 [Thermoproteota archaeon]